MKDEPHQRPKEPRPNKAGRFLPNTPTSKKTPYTGREDSDVSEVMRSPNRQARACSHVRRGRQANASTTERLPTTLASDKSNDKKSSANSNLAQRADEVTQNTLFIPFLIYTLQSPEGQGKKGKMTKREVNT